MPPRKPDVEPKSSNAAYPRRPMARSSRVQSVKSSDGASAHALALAELERQQSQLSGRLSALTLALEEFRKQSAVLLPTPFLQAVARDAEVSLVEGTARVRALRDFAQELASRLGRDLAWPDAAGIDAPLDSALAQIELAKSFLNSPSAQALHLPPTDERLTQEVARLEVELAHERGQMASRQMAAKRWEQSLAYRLHRFATRVKRRASALFRWTRSGQANALFDSNYYLQTYPDVALSGVNPYHHYLTYGADEGRNPNCEFETNWYFDTYPDVRQAGINPLVHYATSGWREGRDPGRHFSTRFYARRNPESTAPGTQPLLHYLRIGRERVLRTMPTKRILLVSTHCPTRAHAGGLRALDIYTRIRANEPDAHIELLTHKNASIDWKYDDLDAIFDEVHLCSSDAMSWSEFAAQRPAPYDFDVIDFHFQSSPEVVARFRSAGRRLLFTPMELLIRSIDIQNAARQPTEAEAAQQKITYAAEVAVSEMVDEVVCVSQPDADYLRHATGLAHVIALETGVSTLEFLGDETIARTRRDPMAVLYLAYFGSMTNREALSWYLEKVHPLVKAKVPHYRLDIVGRGDLSAFASAMDSNANLIGEVPSVSPYIARSRVGIAPALSGAGFRGKINQYSILETPTVASTLAANGLAYRHGLDILVGETPEEFAAGIIELLTNDGRHAEIAANAKQTCVATYSWEARDGEICRIYGLSSGSAAGAPVVHAIVPSYRHAAYITQRIESIVSQSTGRLDLVLIDDCSQDASDEIIRGLQRRYRFRYFRRPINSGTPFSAWEFAAREFKDGLIWICESDDVAEPDFLKRSIAAYSANPDLVLFYCNSSVIDAKGKVIGSTASYFRDQWQDARWTEDFVVDGTAELVNHQFRGMTVPNMSSAVIDARTFGRAYSSILKRFKLTGDWLFVGILMTKGRVAFTPECLSNFRDHGDTARASVDNARSQAEFILTKASLHRLANKPRRELIATLRTDAQRFLHSAPRIHQVLRQMLKVSARGTFQLAFDLLLALPPNQQDLKELLSRVRTRQRARRST